LNQQKATVIAHSKSSVTGKQIITFEVEFWRGILAEVNTHKMLSKNASSSRAIPVPTMLKQVRENTAMPVRFGAANTGMQDKGTHTNHVEIELGTIYEIGSPEYIWEQSALISADIAEAFHQAGFAKQVCNRLIEPYQMMKMVITATELNNLWWLRDHEMADPSFADIVRKMRTAMEASVPTVLNPGDWHVPYYNEGVWIKHTGVVDSDDKIVIVDKFGHSLEHAQIISASCCAQVSYRRLDDTIEKARSVVARLNLQGEEPDQPVHASPLEHIATPIQKRGYVIQMFGDDYEINKLTKPDTWEEGITHMDRDGTLCSGNLKGYIQYRQLVPNHVKKG
jgi:hypothetical protein